jgi:hypothetical protein
LIALGLPLAAFAAAVSVGLAQGRRGGGAAADTPPAPREVPAKRSGTVYGARVIFSPPMRSSGMPGFQTD